MKSPLAPLAAMLLLSSATSPFAQEAGAPGAAVQPVVVRATAHFEFDRTTVLPADQQSLLAEVATMKDVTWRSVSAEGYADSTGSAAYNERLSARRAAAVRAFLLGKGLGAEMVHAQGKGTVDPVADNTTPEGRAQNRRTEVTFSGVRAIGR